LKVAFEIAQKRNKKVCSVDKANVLASMKLWRETAVETHKKYPNIELSHMYVDAMAMELIKAPKKYDVVVTENMFGDILSDLASQATGSIGMLASASLGDLNGKKTALYEPVHGSAPDIMGKGLANPIAMILSFAMALRYSCDADNLATKIETAIKNVLANGYRTRDIATKNITEDKIVTTSQIGDLIYRELEKLFA
jgi:3-isopropylmalate dehydrogenase